MTATISIIIVNFNTTDYLRESLLSIYKHSGNIHEVIVVDNASSDGSVAMVKSEFPQVNLIISDKNLGFGVANNLGVEAARGKYIVLFNSDAYLLSDTPHVLAAYLDSHPEVSCVCPRVVLPGSGDIQPKTFGFTPTIGRIFMQSTGLNRIFKKSVLFRGTDGDYRWAKEMQVGWVSGVCMVMRRQDYLEVGGFDPRFFMYCEDVELCMKLQSKGEIVLYDAADIVHYGGASSKQLSSKIRNAVLQQRHLLIITDEYQGRLSGFIARLILLLGLVIRLSASLLLAPKRGLSNNELLRTCWARTLDLLGMHHLKRISQ
jgi:GT2 family glycosyltransferase